MGEDSAYMASHGHLAGQSGRFALALPGARSPPLTCISKRKLTPMIAGAVKFYNEQKGFGFIQPQDGSQDVFVHATALERAGTGSLVEAQKVSFDTADDRRSGKSSVDNIQVA